MIFFFSSLTLVFFIFFYHIPMVLFFSDQSGLILRPKIANFPQNFSPKFSWLTFASEFTSRFSSHSPPQNGENKGLINIKYERKTSNLPNRKKGKNIFPTRDEIGFESDPNLN